MKRLSFRKPAAAAGGTKSGAPGVGPRSQGFRPKNLEAAGKFVQRGSLRKRFPGDRNQRRARAGLGLGPRADLKARVRSHDYPPLPQRNSVDAGNPKPGAYLRRSQSVRGSAGINPGRATEAEAQPGATRAGGTLYGSDRSRFKSSARNFATSLKRAMFSRLRSIRV